MRFRVLVMDLGSDEYSRKNPMVFVDADYDDKTEAVIAAEYYVDSMEDQNLNAIATVYDTETKRVVYSEAPTNAIAE